MRNGSGAPESRKRRMAETHRIPRRERRGPVTAAFGADSSGDRARGAWLRTFDPSERTIEGLNPSSSTDTASRAKCSLCHDCDRAYPVQRRPAGRARSAP